MTAATMANQVEVEIDFAATTGSSSIVDVVQEAVATILHQEGFVRERSASVAVLLTGDERLRTLNRKFAGEDHVTDVLSFSADAGMEFPTSSDDSSVGQIGDIAISIPQTERQASEKHVPFERELAMLAIHGTLHLLGYDHASPEEQRVMFGKTDEALAEIFEADT